MAVDITDITRMVFGVNYLGANGGDDVEKLWNSRFAAQEAYLVNAQPQENPKEIFKRFQEQLKERNKADISAERCMLVFFVDYTSELSEMAMAAIWNLRNVFSVVLGCQIETVIQFAYVGEKGQDETHVQCANIQKALEKNNEKGVYENYRLCLVGKSALYGTRPWKAAVVFVDLLRRCVNLQDYLPIVGNLGKDNISFLRYGEHNADAYQRLVEEVKRLTALLADTNSTRLRTLVEAKRNAMVDYLDTYYKVDGSQHPQHPDMIVEARSGIFSKDMRAAARKDRNPAYTNAQQRTRAAVELTGERMRQEIEAWFGEQIADVKNVLQKLFEDANVGVQLKLKPVEMKSTLYLPPYPDPGVMPSLTLRYSEQGAADEIGAYLTYIKDSSICTGLANYTAALQGAFEDIPQEKIEAERKELQRQLNRASQLLADALDEEAFCKKVTLENPPESFFEINTAMNVRSAKFLMCRSAHVVTAQNVAALGSIIVHSVDDQLCGIVSFDAAPVKAVMIESVECKDDVLTQLLPEVNYGI